MMRVATIVCVLVAGCSSATTDEARTDAGLTAPDAVGGVGVTQVVFHGNSYTYCLPKNAVCYDVPLRATLGAGWRVQKKGWPGATTSELAGEGSLFNDYVVGPEDYKTEVAPLFDRALIDRRLVLVEITNSVLRQQRTVAEAWGDIKAYLAAAHHEPWSRIYVATAVVPQWNAAGQQAIRDVNALVRDSANETALGYVHIELERRAFFADPKRPGTFVDGLHPSDAGYADFAVAFAAALEADKP